MVERNQTYKCNVCGNMVSVLHAGGGQLVCCGRPMELLEPKSQDQGLEKHVPIIEKTGNGVVVKVGSVPHPMEEAHFIQWIELYTKDDKVYRAFLKPGQTPEALFNVDYENVLMAKEYCNLHGLWKSN
ncbi:desulfoferrodoxin [bacterium]|nr:desulfoferrodoxin [bacterium]